MNPGEAKSKIREMAFDMGACAFGIAHIDLGKPYLKDVDARGLTTAISFGYRLSDAVIDGLKDHPTRTYQYHYRQVNLLLDHIALRIASYIQSLGSDALPVAASQIVDWESLSGHISHKKIARLAGIGWIGRNNLLVNPIHGARLRLCTVLTDLDMPCDQPINEGCGECVACLSSCPGQAISRQGFDLRKCIETIEALRKVESIGSHICGLCVKACRPRK